MEKIKTFIGIVFEKEQIAIHLQRNKDDINKYNEFVEKELNVYCEDQYDSEKKVEFNIKGKIVSPFSDRFYEQSKKSSYPIPRYLFKISEYIHEKYGAVWACYVSFSNPNKSIKKITECFLVTLINEKLKIISDFIVSSDAKEWRHVGGDENKSLRLHNLGKPVKIERYLEPTDEWSLEEYLKDK
ncbi:hypothetical protein VUJ46_07410 [Chryseobacterium sp. MYb264]|uniref:hypothetical protein n=1 Tax=Chryseobacterium sp. MYb264 TaxID=2745153 RepID=UPI002E12F88B|nr:hypothetical protein VUJ46_07410 [Chryseobacterium sp. MYb264]